MEIVITKRELGYRTPAEFKKEFNLMPYDKLIITSNQAEKNRILRAKANVEMKRYVRKRVMKKYPLKEPIPGANLGVNKIGMINPKLKKGCKWRLW